MSRFPYLIGGYQDTSTGRRLAPRMTWSDDAFRRALRIEEFMHAPTAPQRAIGIIGFDENGRAVYGQ